MLFTTTIYKYKYFTYAFIIGIINLILLFLVFNNPLLNEILYLFRSISILIICWFFFLWRRNVLLFIAFLLYFIVFNIEIVRFQLFLDDLDFHHKFMLNTIWLSRICASLLFIELSNFFSNHLEKTILHNSIKINTTKIFLFFFLNFLLIQVLVYYNLFIS